MYHAEMLMPYVRTGTYGNRQNDTELRRLCKYNTSLQFSIWNLYQYRVYLYKATVFVLRANAVKWIIPPILTHIQKIIADVSCCI